MQDIGLKIIVVLFVLSMAAIMYFGRDYFIESRVKAVENGTACYLDMGG